MRALGAWLLLLVAGLAAAASPLNRPLVAGLLAEFPPYQVWPEDADPSGVDLQVLDHLQRSVGLRYGLQRFTSFADLRRALEGGSIDIALATGRNAERERTLIFTEPYAQVRQALVARATESAATLAPDLAGRRLGVSRGEVSEARARELFPGATLEVVDNLAAALQALADGRVDYVLDALPAVRRVVESRRIPGLRVMETYGRPEGALRLAMKRGREAELAELQRGLALLPPEQVLNWQREAIAPSSYLQVAGEFHATEAERSQLRAAGPWRVAFVAADAPYSFIDEQGRPAGLNIDVLRALQERLGVAVAGMQAMPPGEALRAAEAGTVDVLLGVPETAARRSLLSFAGPFRREPMALLARADAGPLTLAQLRGGRLALPPRHWARVLLEARWPQVELVPCGSDDDCAARVVRGEAQAALAQLSRRGPGERAGLVVAGVAEELRAEEFVALAGAQRDLAPVVRRALEDVMFNDLPSIERRWLRPPAPPAGLDRQTVLRWGAAAGAVLLLALLGWWLHARSLRRVLAAQRAAQGAAEAATLARARYLSFMAHEVRNTLSGIAGGVALLEQPQAGGGGTRLLPALRQSAEGTLQLLNDLLDQGRLDAGHLRLLPTPTDAAALVRGVVAELQPAAAAKGLALHVNPEASLPVQHLLDPLRVSQIVRNLVANAVKYTSSGSVLVYLQRKAVGDGHDELLLSVQDTGVGIAPADRERLFLPYGQVDPQAGGTGLGLALCRQLADLMGGTIEVESTPGSGSTFRFTLRAARA